MHSPENKHPTITFSHAVQQAVKELGYTQWTPIQEMAIPVALAGKDIIAQSHTGSGKTAAFGLPIIEKINPNGKTQALILVPTRELAEQVMQEMRKFAKHKRMSITAVYGGASMGLQIQHLRRTDIVVGTPGRILDHLERRTFNPTNVQTLVLDEADRMLDMGFIRDMKKILQQVPAQRQTMLFSATLSPDIQTIARSHMKHPEMVQAEAYVDKGKLTQTYYDLDKQSDQKFALLTHILKNEKPPLAIIFAGTRRMVDKVERNLNQNGIQAQAIHGGLSQNQRKRTLESFHQGHFHVLVASDVAARGLDIKNVSHIINYDIPRTPSEYIHRSGRTARAGEEGKIISLLVPQDYDYFRSILRDKSLPITEVPLPSFEPVAFGNKKGKPEYESSERKEHGGKGPYSPRGHSAQGRPSYGSHARPSYGRSESQSFASGHSGSQRSRNRPHEFPLNPNYSRPAQSPGAEGEGRRFFPKKNRGNENTQGNRFGNKKPFGAKRDDFKPGSGLQFKKGKPKYPKKDEDFKVTKHFGLKHAPKDD